VPKTKLQKQLSRRVGDKRYTKWVITIPREQVKRLGWASGDEIEAIVKDDKLVLIAKGSEKNE